MAMTKPEHGQGLSSQSKITPTRGPSFPHQANVGRSLGETGGTGSQFSAIIVEWPNKSNNRNMGPGGPPSPVSKAMPIITQNQRHTGKIG